MYLEKINNDKLWDDDNTCLIKNFFNEQKKLPQHLQSKFAMISCPCEKCILEKWLNT